MTHYYADDSATLYLGDALKIGRQLESGSVDCIVTSPPYFGLRDYGYPGQYGLEASPTEYAETLCTLFAELRRVLADDGTLWLNLGDSYASDPGNGRGSGSTLLGRKHDHAGAAAPTSNRRKPGVALPRKNLLGIPWRVAFALQDDGWILRNEVIWAKPNGMPESTTDRLSKRHEHVFMFAKSARYWFDLDAVREQYDGDRDLSRRVRSGSVNKENSVAVPWNSDRGRNPGDVWTIPTQPFPGAHFAVMPTVLAERCIQAGCKPHGVVLDPFSGSGTTGLAAARHGRRYVGIDLKREYLDLSIRTRLAQPPLDFAGDGA
ncbi:DNA methyltransferase [Gordonia phage RogerDodger]|uniref:site-specific DNA-methyltransferase (cytosine-N(4)-specific) n=2 Tax=Wizardvirus TaxID=2169658 RepID=A0A515MHT8_9CAUD|nr:DNA methyltransferase [Gordonia phage Danyall]YP_010103072.1 DNA methyltransferase [Gordonia phage RogerDodger]AXH45539.1 DNA methylase [Gordonia phage Danyall]QDM56144.1 methyltransferase [Gordonia phage RogerDodger]UVK63769.1 DNA methyltransferase [Gordonia phage PullumCavea]